MMSKQSLVKLAVWVTLSTLGCGEDPSNDSSTYGGLANDPGPAGALLWDHPLAPRVAMWQLSDGRVSKDSVIGDAPAGWKVIGGGDFDNDGNGDVLWFEPGSRTASIWQLSGSSLLSFSSISLQNASVSDLKIGDFDGDGKSDLLAISPEGKVQVLFTKSLSSVQPSTTGMVVPPSPPAAIADFNGDGRSDIVFAGTSPVTIWAMNADGSHTEFSPGSAAPPWRLVGAADFNVDGISDLFWYNPDSGQTGAWVLSGPGMLTSWSNGPVVPTEWQPVLTADLNGDHIADVVWRHQTGLVSVWTMDGPTSVRSFGKGQPSGPEWVIRGVTKLSSPPPAPPSLPALDATVQIPAKTKKVLVVPCYFDGNGGRKMTAAELNTYFQKMPNYFSTLSYGALDVQFTISNTWYPMGDYDENFALYSTPPPKGARGDRVREARQCIDQASQAFDLSAFDALTAVWINDGNGQFDNAGAAGKYVVLGQSRLSGNFDFLEGVGAQELIHAIAIPQHAWSEDGEEYGDPYDTMSCTRCSSSDLNAFYRSRLFGLPSNRLTVLALPATAGKQEQVVTLAAQGRPDAIGSLALQVDAVDVPGVGPFHPWPFPLITGRYYAEFRTRDGLNGGLAQEAVLIHRVDADGLRSLLMGKKAGSDPEWLLGDNFQNVSDMLEIAVLDISPVSGRATVKVTLKR